MRQKILVLAVVLLWSVPCYADKYVRDGGTSSACTSWTDACDQVSTAIGVVSRGETIWIADGAYTGFTFNVANSGSTRIWIKKAIASDHGTDTGWSSTYGDGQAVFSSDLTVTRGYLTFDGQTGGGPGSWETGFGFKFDGHPGIGNASPNTDVNADYVVLRHFEIDHNDTTDTEDHICIVLDNNVGWTIEYFYLHDVGCDVFKVRYSNSDITIQYGKVKSTYQGTVCHGDLIEIPAGTVSGTFTVRYNYFEDVVGSYLFGVHEYAEVTNYEIYGNILHFKSKASSTGNGTIGSLSGCSGCGINLKFYNNTIAGIFGANILGALCDDGGTFSGSIINNIWYEGSDQGYSFGYGDYSNSYNSHYNMAAVSGTGNLNPTGNPFTNINSNDLSLVSGTTAGTTLASPYNVDMFGVTRGGDGTWDRGAIEYGSGSGDSTAPTGSFDLPATYGSLIVPISTFTCADETALAASPYCVTTVNSSSGCSWAASAPATITFTGAAGSKTGYAWCKDLAGNISTGLSDSVTVFNPTSAGATFTGVTRVVQ